MSLGNDFRDLMMQAANALEPGVIDAAKVDRVANGLNLLSGLENLARHINPADGSIDDLHAGSVLMSPGGLRVGGDETFLVQTGAGYYNQEAVEDGDVVFGSNKEDQANLYWDKSSGEIQFRGGTTQQGRIDSSGAAIFGGGAVIFDSSGISLSLDAALTQEYAVKWVGGSKGLDPNGDIQIVGYEWGGGASTFLAGLDLQSGSPTSGQRPHGSDISLYAYSDSSAGSTTPNYIFMYMYTDDGRYGGPYFEFYNKFDGVVRTLLTLGPETISLHPYASTAAPSASSGTLWYDTGTTSLKIYLSGDWRSLSSW